MSAVHSSSQPPVRQRMSVTFDRGVLIERLLLKRWESLSRNSQPGWLRSLLVQGFMVECSWLRAAEGREPSDNESRNTTITRNEPESRYSNWLSERSTRNAARIKCPVPTPASMLVSTQADKPFAHLRRVIG